jgi:hypothetical protein
MPFNLSSAALRFCASLFYFRIGPSQLICVTEALVSRALQSSKRSTRESEIEAVQITDCSLPARAALSLFDALREKVTTMPDDKRNLYLFEAIELRAEYDARIKLLRSLLPESRESRDRFSFRRDDEVRYTPAAGFDAENARHELDTVNVKRRKLNTAIQRVNFDTTIEIDGEKMSLSEALEMRKSINERIGELSTQLTNAAYDRILYKEERDIVEKPDLSYEDVRRGLEDKRRSFRALNRVLRGTAHTVTVGFKDED